MEELLENYALNKSLKSKTGKINVGLVGCGSMGQEIAILISKSGIDITFVEISEENVQQSFDGINTQIDDIISHWGMTKGDKRAILSRIKGTTKLEDLAESSIVIEAINTRKWIPNQPVRKEVFKKLESIVSETCVLVSNASTIVISDLAAGLKFPCRAVGVHFISPVLRNKIIEINRCKNTNEDTMIFINRFVRMIDKETIHIFGAPGNISTRLIVPMINEACGLLMEGVSTVDQIDKTMKLGYGMQRGPFTMADYIGLDKLTKWMEGLYNEYGDMKYKTSPLIRRMVRAGLLGKKTGEGFYVYKDGKRLEKNGTIFNLGQTPEIN